MLGGVRRLFQALLGGESPVLPSVLFDRHGDAIDDRVRVATVALLLRMAASDGDLHKEEVATIASVIARHFAMGDEEVRNLFQKTVENPPGGRSSERVLLWDFDQGQRELIYALLLLVVQADRRFAPEEEVALRVAREELVIDGVGAERALELVRRGDV